jgi:hypothetical protein
MVQCQKKHTSNYPTTQTNYTEEYHFSLYNNSITFYPACQSENQDTIRNSEPAT